MVDGTDVAKRVLELDTQLEAKFPNISARVKKMFLGPSDAKTIKIQVRGPDKNVIYQKAQQIMDLLHEVPNTINIRNDWENLIVKIDVRVDQHRAKRAGLTSTEIANALQTYFSGAQITEFREEDEIIPIVFARARSRTKQFRQVTNVKCLFTKNR